MKSFYNYFNYGLKNYSDDLLIRIRKKIFRFFINEFSPKENDLILDVGVSEDDHVAANYFEKQYPYKINITACGIIDPKMLKKVFEEISFVQCDGKYLPFRSAAFDYVYSHAVIEHVGSRLNQEIFLDELIRVAKKGVFLTTPNRYHPFEFHTGIPFLHFFPQKIYHFFYRILGKSMYSDENSLNLLSEKDIISIIKRDTVENINVKHVYWLNLPSNIILSIKKHC